MWENFLAKACTKCGETKVDGDFYLNTRTRDNLTSWCRECTKELSRSRSRK